MTVPDTCPGCAQPLFHSYLHRPQPKWQPRARALFLTGAAISGPLMLAMPYLIGYLIALVDPPGAMNKGGRGTIGIFAWTGGVLLALVPGLILGAWAYRIPRTVRLDCRHCGWGETFYLPAGGGRRVARPDPGGVE